MGNKKSRINFDPNEQLRDDATFLVQGKFGSKQLKLHENMVVEDLNPAIEQGSIVKELGNIFYNKEFETFTYLGYNGKTRSNFKENYENKEYDKPLFEEYKRCFYLKKRELDYNQLQYDAIKSRLNPETTNDKPYNLYVINLEHRDDRRNQIKEDLKNTNLFNINFFKAVKHNNGWMGCGLSHCYLIAYALENNLPYIIVAEDDFQLKISEEKVKIALDLLTSNLDKWEIFNGSPTFFEKDNLKEKVNFYKTGETLDTLFVKGDWGQSASFMIYNASVYKKLLRYSFSAKNYINDQYNAKKFLQIFYKPENFSIQKSSYSNLSNSFRGADYEQLFINYHKKILDAKPEVEKTIGIYSIFVGDYVYFYENFIKNCEISFLPQYKKNYYIVTDKDLPVILNTNTYFLKVEQIGWPYETLYRYKYFLMFNQEDLAKSDIFYFVNGNGQFLTTINCNVFPTENGYTFTIHNAFHNKKYKKLTYEKNPKSTAYIPEIKKKKYVYYAGGFFGATKDKFITLCDTLDKAIQKDEENNYIAEWHDESHLNKYVNTTLNNDNNLCKILLPEYHIPQEILAKKYKKMNCKLTYLDKKRYLKNSETKDMKKCKNNRHGEIIPNKYNKIPMMVSLDSFKSKLKGTLPYRFSTKIEAETTYDIERSIHFMWITSPIPQKYIDNVKRCQEINGKNFKIHVWVDHQCPEIPGVEIKQMYDIKFVNDDIRTRERAMGLGCLTDMLSYEMIYSQGGIYCDIDAVFTKPLDENFYKSFISHDIGEWNNITHGIFGFPKGSKFMKFVLDALRENGDKHPETKYPPSRTGPTFLTTCVVQYNDNNIKSINQKFTINKHPSGYLYQTNDATWVNK
jgi:GR25 family glycosyltransferase involved in LPS biosynthesis